MFLPCQTIRRAADVNRPGASAQRGCSEFQPGMSERPLEPERHGGGIRNGQPAASPPAEDFEALRELLLGPEQEALRKLADPATRLQEISDALPEALAKRGPHDRLLARALRPTVEETVSQSIRRQPQYFADLLAPVIAPTIRRAIAQAFESTLQAIREMTSRTFSMQGLKWRLEAWRSGISVGEIALRQTLKYRAEQVFLIHRESGVLLQYVSIPGAPGADSDMVSGMLTAIGQFVTDSFKTDAGESLDAIKVGEFRVWMERGPKAILAATIRGTPAADYRTVLQDTLDGIHALHHAALNRFQGDTSAFDVCRPELEACLRSESSVPSRKKLNLRPLRWGFALIALGYLGWIAYAVWSQHLERGRRADLVKALDAEPGIMTTSAQLDVTPIKIRGLRDPLARDPGLITRAAGFPESAIDARWESFYSLDPALIERRAKQELAAPEGVKLQFDSGTLRVEGTAPHAWIELFRRNARAVPGIAKVDDAKLIDTDLLRWHELASRVEAILIRFDGNGEAIGPAQREEVEKAAAIAREAVDPATKLGRQTQIEATGEMFRASVVATALNALDAPPAIVRAGPPKSGATNTVSLRLQLLDSARER